MNTLEIRKPLSLELGLRATLAKSFGNLLLAIENWRHRGRQTEIDAYLGQSLNMSDLERRLREVQYPQEHQGGAFSDQF
jgi:hypothetical protein